MACARLFVVLTLSGLPLVSLQAAQSEDAKASEAAADAMARVNTWGHSDQFYEGAGMQAYVAHRYKHAMDQFKRSARLADKLSQLSIGLMYLNGEGIGKDPITAYAWLSLAAERNYPSFVATRDTVGKSLSSAQRQQADGVLQSLLKEYGDAVAKPRMIHELRMAMGTVNPVGRPPIGAYTSLGGAADREPYCGPFGGRGDCGFYASWRWDPKQYFAARDAQWDAPSVGKVTVLPLQKVDKPASADPSNH
jgi:TPR repeat protein